MSSLDFWNEEKAPFDFRVLAWKDVARPSEPPHEINKLVGAVSTMRAKAVSLTVDDSSNVKALDNLTTTIGNNVHVESVDLYFPDGVSFDQAKALYWLLFESSKERLAFHVSDDDRNLLVKLTRMMQLYNAPEILEFDYKALSPIDKKFFEGASLSTTLRALTLPKKMTLDHSLITRLFSGNHRLTEIHLDVQTATPPLDKLKAVEYNDVLQIFDYKGSNPLDRSAEKLLANLPRSLRVLSLTNVSLIEPEFSKAFITRIGKDMPNLQSISFVNSLWYQDTLTQLLEVLTPNTTVTSVTLDVNRQSPVMDMRIPVSKFITENSTVESLHLSTIMFEHSGYTTRDMSDMEDMILEAVTHNNKLTQLSIRGINELHIYDQILKRNKTLYNMLVRQGTQEGFFKNLHRLEDYSHEKHERSYDTIPPPPAPSPKRSSRF